MFRHAGPKKKFTLTLITLYVLSLPVASVLTYLVLRQNALRDAHDLGRLRLATMNAVKHYVAEELRPLFYRELPGRFIVEGMSRSYVADNVARRVQKEIPAYQYKNASLNPKNTANAADGFETEIIRTFQNDRERTEWSGFRTKPDGEYYVVARPGEPLSDDCLRCHGEPGAAPAELIGRYGTTAGFHMKTGEFADAAFVYVPISVPLAAARKAVAIFIGIYMVSGVVLLFIVNSRFTKLYSQIDADRERIEDINLELINLNQDMESIITERTMNLVALNIADRIRNPATVIAGTCSRILRKETLQEPLRERLSDLMIEAQKLDAIVRDYETILKNKRMMFRGEDMNEIVQSVVPLIEGERKSREILLSLMLSDSPSWFIGNRQLLRVAILHLLKNAVEATPPGGSITVTTAFGQDTVLLCITDTGKGIPEKDLAKIFSLFYSTKKHRIGMGLPLVKQIMEEHKGEITVDSTVNSGTTFRVTLPVRLSEKELQGKSSGGGTLPGKRADSPAGS